jgi:cytochrome c553
MTRRLIIATTLFVLAAGCGSSGPPQSEDYGNLFNSPEGLILIEDEHPTGWGRPDCFSCHEVRNIHTINRTGLADLDLAAVRAVVQSEGLASCSQCHGDNGVQP